VLYAYILAIIVRYKDY